MESINSDSAFIVNMEHERVTRGRIAGLRTEVNFKRFKPETLLIKLSQFVTHNNNLASFIIINLKYIFY